MPAGYITNIPLTRMYPAGEHIGQMLACHNGLAEKYARQEHCLILISTGMPYIEFVGKTGVSDYNYMHFCAIKEFMCDK